LYWPYSFTSSLQNEEAYVGLLCVSAFIWQILCVDSMCCQIWLAISSPTVDQLLTKNPPKTYIARETIKHILLQCQLHKYTPKSNLIINKMLCGIQGTSHLSLNTNISQGLCKEHADSSRKWVFNEMTLIHNIQNRHVKDQWWPQ
jgi:hypothetical protein